MKPPPSCEGQSSSLRGKQVVRKEGAKDGGGREKNQFCHSKAPVRLRGRLCFQFGSPHSL